MPSGLRHPIVVPLHKWKQIQVIRRQVSSYLNSVKPTDNSRWRIPHIDSKRQRVSVVRKQMRVRNVVEVALLCVSMRRHRVSMTRDRVNVVLSVVRVVRNRVSMRRHRVGVSCHRMSVACRHVANHPSTHDIAGRSRILLESQGKWSANSDYLAHRHSSISSDCFTWFTCWGVSNILFFVILNPSVSGSPKYRFISLCFSWAV